MPNDPAPKKSRKEVTITKTGEYTNALTDIRALVIDAQAALSLAEELDAMGETIDKLEQAGRLTSLEALLSRCVLSGKSAAKHRTQASLCLSEEIDGYGRQMPLSEFEIEREIDSHGEERLDGEEGGNPGEEGDNLIRSDITAQDLMEATGHGASSEAPAQIPTVPEEEISGDQPGEPSAAPQEPAQEPQTPAHIETGPLGPAQEPQEPASAPGPMEADEESGGE